MGAGISKRGRVKQDQQWKIILVLQVTPHFEMTMGTPQTIISYKAGRLLIGQGEKHQVFNQGGSAKFYNKNLAFTKDFKEGLLVITDQNEVQAFIWQFKLDARGN